jgi:hypothetical protein
LPAGSPRRDRTAAQIAALEGEVEHAPSFDRVAEQVLVGDVAAT